jgi:hypothetical protein
MYGTDAYCDRTGRFYDGVFNITFHGNNTISLKGYYYGKYLGIDGTTTSNLKNSATTLTDN